jgi:hypothetical protein
MQLTQLVGQLPMTVRSGVNSPASRLSGFRVRLLKSLLMQFEFPEGHFCIPPAEYDAMPAEKESLTTGIELDAFDTRQTPLCVLSALSGCRLLSGDSAPKHC